MPLLVPDWIAVQNEAGFETYRAIHTVWEQLGAEVKRLKQLINHVVPPAAGVDGIGTANHIPKWLDSDTLEDTPHTVDANDVLAINGQYHSPIQTHASSGAALTIDWNDGNDHVVTLDANCTLTFSNPASAARLVLVLIQDGTGSRTVTWPASVVWPAATAPTLTTTASRADLFVFLYLPSQGKFLGAKNLNYTV